MPTIEVRATGHHEPLAAARSFTFAASPSAGPIRTTLRDVIRRAVETETADFAARQARGQLVQMLTAERVSQGLAAGRVSPGSRQAGAEVDVSQAVAIALRAFEDGRYLVVIDGRQRTALDEEVTVGDESTITFLRLVALVGG